MTQIEGQPQNFSPELVYIMHFMFNIFYNVQYACLCQCISRELLLLLLDPRREGPMNSVLLVSQSVSDAIPGNLVQEIF